MNLSSGVACAVVDSAGLAGYCHAKVSGTVKSAASAGSISCASGAATTVDGSECDGPMRATPSAGVGKEKSETRRTS